MTVLTMYFQPCRDGTRFCSTGDGSKVSYPISCDIYSGYTKFECGPSQAQCCRLELSTVTPGRTVRQVPPALSSMTLTVERVLNALLVHL